MKFNMQSDKIVKIFTKVNVLTNVEFEYDISFDLNELLIKKNQNYIFSTFLIDFKNKEISTDLLRLCEQENYLNLLILEEKKSLFFKKFTNLIQKFHSVYGKKIILVSKKDFLSNKFETEHIFFIKTNNLKNKKFLKTLSKKLKEI
tara:strand:+ start:53 stop:490 length:438 start_codon:yes stop_codon:yes gene_type:complete